MKPLISVEHLSWSYIGSSRRALDDLNFELMPGEVLGITGASGAGKTTLTLCMNSLIPNNFHGEYSGSVMISDRKVSESRVCDLAQYVGIVFQDPESQFMGMTVEEELVFTLENLGFSDEEITRRIAEAIETVGMADFMQRSPFSLSGGQKQKVAIASCLALEPAVLVLDEPTSELDPVGASEVFSVLQNLKKQKSVGIIVVSHATEDLALLCDRVMLMSEGKQICLRKIDEFFSDVALLDEYGVQIPQITEAFSMIPGIGKEDLPITLDEAVRKLRGA